SIRSRCVALQEVLGHAGAAVKWVEPDNIHVTLLFLGEVDERDVPAVCRSVADSCAGLAPFGMSVEGGGSFGNRRRPRTLGAGVAAGSVQLIALHDALEQPLLDLGCYRREERAYSPHVTLGRVKSEGPCGQLFLEMDRQAGWRGGECE